MGIGVLDSDFISARDLQIEYFSRTGKELSLIDLLGLSSEKIYFYMNYSDETLKFRKNNKLIAFDKSYIHFKLIDPSYKFAVAYNHFNDEFSEIAPKIINDKNEIYNFPPFNLSAKIIYKQEIKGLFKNIRRYLIGLSDNIEFSGFFPIKDVYCNGERSTIHFRSVYSLLENKFTNTITDESASLIINLPEITPSFFLTEMISLDSVYHLKKDIPYLLKKYDSENKNLKKISKLSKEINISKEETYRQIIAGLICCLNPNFKYEKNKKPRKILKSNGYYNCNAIKDNIILALDKLNKDGKIVDDIRKDTIIRDYLKEIIEEIEYK